MGKRQKTLNKSLVKFILEQKMFFVSTAMDEGHINLSPKGMDTMRILSHDSVLWLNLTGSGNETSTHLQYKERMTIMFCAFEGRPKILRLYGKAKAYHQRHPFWDEHIKLFPEIPGSRQLIALHIELVQTSCGMGVPYLEYKGERNQLDVWAADKGEMGLQDYYKQKNLVSLDGHSSDIFEDHKK